VALVIAITLAALAVNGGTLPVTAPLIATLVSALAFLLVLAARRRGEILWFEIGLVYAAIVTLYATYPLAGFLILRHTYTTGNDLRLQQMAPDAAAVGRIGWLYVAHLLAFMASYVVVRGRLPLRMSRPQSPALSVGLAALAFYVAIQGFWFYDTTAESYIESYLVARRLPLFLAQVLGHLNGAQYPLAIALLVLLFTRYPGSRPILVAWVIVTAAVTAMRLGSRTEFALFVFAATVIYHSLVRRISVRVMTVGAVAGLALFVAFGVVRAGGAGSGSDAWYVLPFSQSSDFEVLFANAMHLDRVVTANVPLALPDGFSLGDVAALLPQQIAPYAKVDLAAWYVSTFFPEYAAAGGGLAFGVIAESVITGGWLSALIRGALLGLLFAGIHRYYVRHAHRFWVFVFYVWVTTLSYQAFRATTLYLLVPFVYRFVVVMLIVKVAATMLDRATRSPKGRYGRADPVSLPESTVR
jgi:oligosaccharide repeat unit polymerase